MVEVLRSPGVSREKLMHALYEAAELEQNLMCTYLYAAFSLKSGEGEGLSAEEAIAVADWRQTIIDVAIDEMGHLVAVWNITSALGGAPQFGRSNFPLDPGLLPGGVVVRLAPFSKAVIQHFIHLERPSESHEPDGEGFAPQQTVTRTPTPLHLTPTAYDYATVGAFYENIGDSLRALVARIGEAEIFCGQPGLQLSPAEVDLDGATQVTDLDSAIVAFDTIIAQGEGAPSHTEDSHFQRFVAIREQYQALSKSNPLFAAAHPSAQNPVLRKPPRPEGRVWIEDVEAIATVDLANAIYALTLRLLAGSYALIGPSSEKELYVDVAISLMRALTPLAERAARLPAGPSHPGFNAGISFTALRDSASLPPGASARHFYIERIFELVDAAEAMDQTDTRCAQATRVLLMLAARLRDAPLPEDDARRFLAAQPDMKAPLIAILAPVGDADHGDGTELMVSFDGNRCIHARFCVTQAPATFLANVDGPWIFPDATVTENLAAVVRECPSGALSYRRMDGQDETAPPINLCTIRENGPHALRADLRIDNGPVGFRATLCRCGSSKNKPFCDGSHQKIGFTATGEPATNPSEALVVRNGPIDIAPELDGPLQVRGNLEILSGTGRTVARLQTVRLCRCGGSGNKPFCDNAHRKIGFRST
jgi:CDGSH-type Zn-finger protein/uncharacterized Fe-S cluster protein YjdI